MSTYFFDTSALVKRYHQEDRTERVDEILDSKDADILISSLAVVESVSAFRRKYNRGEISESEMEQLVGVFFREALDDFVIIPLDDSDCCESLPLRIRQTPVSARETATSAMGD